MDWFLVLRLVNAFGALICLWLLGRSAVHQWGSWNYKTRTHWWALSGWVFLCIEGTLEQIALDTAPGPRTILTTLTVVWTLRALTIEQEVQAEPMFRKKWRSK